MKNKVLFTVMMLTAGYAYSSENTIVEKTATETQTNEPTITFNRLGVNVRAHVEISPKYKQVCKWAAGCAGFGAILKFAPQVVNPTSVRLGLLATAGLYAAKSFKNCSWTDLFKSIVSSRKKAVVEKTEKKSEKPSGSIDAAVGE